jgi:hypothetical protein
MIMATTAVAVLLLTLYWVLNYGAKGRLQKIKFLSFLYDPQKAVLQRINLVLLFAAGFGLSGWLSGIVGRLNFPLFSLGIKLFTVLMLAGAILFIIDCLDGNGIKKSSYGISFLMPVIAASSGGAIAATILAVSGGINQYAGALLATLV